MNVEALSRSGNPNPAHAPVRAVDANTAWMVYRMIPDLINGARVDFAPIFIEAGLDAAYHWPCDDLVAQFGAVTDAASMRTAVTREAAIYINSMRDQVTNLATRTAMASLLAWARVISRRAYGIVEADVNPNQLMANVADLFAAPANGVQANPAGTNDLAAWEAIIAAAVTWYDDNYTVVLPNMSKMAIAAPVLNGVLLVYTGMHHFVDPHKQVMRVVTKQVFGTNDPGVAHTTTEQYEDVMFHKAFHPVKSSRLTWLAREEDMRVRLRALGVASAAVRVPALFPSERAMSAARALVATVEASAGEYNLAIDGDAFRAAAAGVTLGGPVTPTTISTHADNVAAFFERQGGNLAWCAGFVSAMADETPAELGRMSILRAESVRRIAREHAAQTASGMNHYKVARRWMRAQANAGRLPGVGLFGAAAPGERGNPEN